MDFTILAVVLLIGVGVPIRNKLIRKYRDNRIVILYNLLICNYGHNPAYNH